MNLSPNLPPNIEEIKQAIPNLDIEHMVFTYGDTVYNVKLDIDGKAIPLDPHLEVHERIHIAQQAREGVTPESWWKSYLASPEFRLKEEVEAYAKQYEFVKSFAPSDQAKSFLFQLAVALRESYGFTELTHGQAEAKIRNGK